LHRVPFAARGLRHGPCRPRCGPSGRQWSSHFFRVVMSSIFFSLAQASAMDDGPESDAIEVEE
jgi:hypothetical protein